MLATFGNVVGNTKCRRGAKAAKDKLTVGLIWNATGTDFWKPVFIRSAKRPRCFGRIWKPENLGGLYYHKHKAWMKQDIWWDVNRKFNMGEIVLFSLFIHSHIFRFHIYIYIRMRHMS